MSDKILVEIDLGTIAGPEQDVAGIIVDRASRILLDHNRETTAAFLDRVAQIAAEEIREAIRPLVAAALMQPIQKTNTYGTPVGEPLPLNEHIIEIAREAMSQPIGRDYDRKKSLLQTILAEEVERVLRTELQNEIKQAKAEVLAAVHEQGARVITETIERLART